MLANTVYTLLSLFKRFLRTPERQKKNPTKLALAMSQATTAISSLPFIKMSTVLVVVCLFNYDFLVLQSVCQNPSLISHPKQMNEISLWACISSLVVEILVSN